MLDFVFDRRSFLRIGSIGASMTAAGFTEYAFSAQDGFDAYEDKTVFSSKEERNQNRRETCLTTLGGQHG